MKRFYSKTYTAFSWLIATNRRILSKICRTSISSPFLTSPSHLILLSIVTWNFSDIHSMSSHSCLWTVTFSQPAIPLLLLSSWNTTTTSLPSLRTPSWLYWRKCLPPLNSMALFSLLLILLHVPILFIHSFILQREYVNTFLNFISFLLLL